MTWPEKTPQPRVSQLTKLRKLFRNYFACSMAIKGAWQGRRELWEIESEMDASTRIEMAQKLSRVLVFPISRILPAPPASCTKKSSTIGNRKLENFSLYLFWLHWLDSTPPVLRYTHTPTYIWAYPAYIDNQLPLSCAVLLSKVFPDRRVLSSNRKLSDGKNFNGAASKPRDWNFNCKTGSFQFAASCHLGNSPPRSLKLSEMPPKNWHKVRCN